jgi:hypothetical protein
MKTRHSIPLYLDKPMLDWLRAEAARRRSSMAQVVRDLIIESMAQKSE